MAVGRVVFVQIEEIGMGELRVSRVELLGRVLPDEARSLKGVLGRLGFHVETDPNTGLTTATRPDVITKPEFVTAVVNSGRDTKYYGAVAWSALRELVLERRGSISDLPIVFMPGRWNRSHSAKDNLLIANTLPPTIPWVREHTDLYGVTERLALALEAVADALPTILDDQVGSQ